MPKANDDAEKQNLGTRRDGLLRRDEDDGTDINDHDTLVESLTDEKG